MHFFAGISFLNRRKVPRVPCEGRGRTCFRRIEFWYSACMLISIPSSLICLITCLFPLPLFCRPALLNFVNPFLQEAWDRKETTNSCKESYHLSWSQCAENVWSCTHGTRDAWPKRGAWAWPLVGANHHVASTGCKRPESVLLFWPSRLICSKFLVHASASRLLWLARWLTLYTAYLSLIIEGKHVLQVLLQIIACRQARVGLQTTNLNSLFFKYYYLNSFLL